MVKKMQPKLFKFVRKAVNDDKNHLVLRFKNLDGKQIKRLKSSLNEYIVDFFEEDDEKEDKSN